MPVDRTLILVKPDAFARGLSGEVIAAFERKGLRIAALQRMEVGRDLAERHYAEHRETDFFGELVDFITTGEVVVARVAGEKAVSVVRLLMGPTDPAAAPPGTIRGDYGTVITENLVHGSDSPESAKRELDLFFG